MGIGALPASFSSGGVFQGEAGREMSPTAAHRQEERGAEGDFAAWRGAQVIPLGKEKTEQIPKLPISAQQAEAKPLLQTLLEVSGSGNCVEMCSSGFCVPGKLSHIQLPGAASKNGAEAIPFPPWGAGAGG